jgi:multiple sugar transport system ATP-binding protein
VPGSEIDRRVRAAAARVALDALLDRRPAQLSGGQQQRVALARAVVRNPAVYLMDEPLSNLDAQLRLQTRTELKRLHQELGTTIVYVTHDQAEAMTLGTRIAIMQEGSIVQVGPPLDLYRRPHDTFVARFLGSPPINLLPREGLRPQASGVRAVSGSSHVGIRPEDVQVAREGAPGRAPAVAVVLETMGSESLLTLERDGMRIVARVAPDVRVEPGQQVWISFPADRILFFGSDGRRIQEPADLQPEASGLTQP